jgi:hypothetical protein
MRKLFWLGVIILNVTLILGMIPLDETLWEAHKGLISVLVLGGIFLGLSFISEKSIGPIE